MRFQINQQFKKIRLRLVSREILSTRWQASWLNTWIVLFQIVPAMCRDKRIYCRVQQIIAQHLTLFDGNASLAGAFPHMLLAWTSVWANNLVTSNLRHIRAHVTSLQCYYSTKYRYFLTRYVHWEKMQHMTDPIRLRLGTTLQIRSCHWVQCC